VDKLQEQECTSFLHLKDTCRSFATFMLKKEMNYPGLLVKIENANFAGWNRLVY